MTNEGASQESRRTCRSVLIFGCGAVFLVIIVAGVLLFTNWDNIRQSSFAQSFLGLGQSFANESTELLQLRRYLIDKYPSDTVGVRFQRKYSESLSESANSLVVEFLNPEFIDDLYTSNTQDQAVEIARDVVAYYLEIDKYETVSIKFIIQGEAGSMVGNTATFNFPIQELQSNG